MNKILLFSILPFFAFSQIQVGNAINGKFSNDQSGNSVALSSDGTIVAIGTSNNALHNNTGYVSIYKNDNGSWSQIGDDIFGQTTGEKSGFSISLSSNGTIVAIGAPYNDNNGLDAGSVRIFYYNGLSWNQVGSVINGENAGDLSGYSVSLSDNGKTVAIGAKYNDGNGSNAGQVRVYSNIGGAWLQIGEDIDGENANDESGSSISLSSDGTVVAIGAEKNNGNGVLAGHVRIFKNTNNQWTKLGNDIDGESENDFSGTVSLSSNGTIVAIGAKFNDQNGSASGQVRIFEYINNNWNQVGNSIVGENEGDQSGYSVSLSDNGNIVAIGAIGNDDNGNFSGHTRIYQKTSDSWYQVQNTINGASSGILSGYSISLSSEGTTLAIGAINSNNNGTNSGDVNIYSIDTTISSNLNSLSFNSASFSIYPNPTSEYLNIDLQQNLTLKNVNFYNNIGQLVKTTSNPSIDLSDLSKGNYFVEIVTNQGKAIKNLIIN